jgi:hypothetical protein
MPHQREMVDVALEIDPATGLLAYGEVIVIGPRQATGKTEIILPMLTHRCVGFDQLGPQRVMYTAQTADDARKKWRDVHMVRLKASRRFRRMFVPRMSYTFEAFQWANGSMWVPGSTTGSSAGTGDSLDVGVIDEAWSRPDNRTELGMRPAMMTRDSHQLWVMSMIPGISRAQPGSWPYLAGKREVGRMMVGAGVRSGVAFFDYAAPDDRDPADPATWYLGMPGLGRTVREGTVADDFAAMDLVDFCAEYLGWAPKPGAARWTWVSEATWAALCDPYSTITGSKALAVEVADDRSRAWIGVSGQRFDGHRHGEVVEPGYKIAAGTEGMTWVEPRLFELVDSHKPCTVVIDPAREGRSLIVPLRNRGVDVFTPNKREIAGACGRFYDATGQNATPDKPPVSMIYHLDQLELATALRGAKPFDIEEGVYTLVKKGGVTDIGALYCVILAMLGHEVKGAQTVPEPEIFI